MSAIASKILKYLAMKQLQTVPISKIRCVEFKVGIEEGWGGKPIEYFPPYRFFQMYAAGKKETASKEMEDWYYKRMITRRYVDRPKCEGGMANGSLFKEIKRLHEVEGITLASNMNNADEALVHKVLHQHVKYRFSIMHSIQTQGFLFNWDFVRLTSTSDSNLFYLRGGHHRVAALAVCGQSHVLATVTESLCLKILRKTATVFFKL